MERQKNERYALVYDYLSLNAVFLISKNYDVGARAELFRWDCVSDWSETGRRHISMIHLLPQHIK